MQHSIIRERTYVKKLIIFIFGFAIGYFMFLMILQIIAPSTFIDKKTDELTDFADLVSITLSLLTMILYSILAEYNYLKKLELTCESLLSNISIYKKREKDLLKKAWNIISKFLGHEGDVQKTVSQLRSNNISGNKIDSNKLNNIKELKLVVENYPELKSDAHITKILVQVEESQNIIMNGKLQHNEYVTFYNGAMLSFPALLFIGLWKLKKLNLYVDDISDDDLDI